jgi:hypothetical protein
MGDMKPVYCPTKEMVADLLTKPLAKPSFLQLRDKLNMETFKKFCNDVKLSKLETIESREAVEF